MAERTGNPLEFPRLFITEAMRWAGKVISYPSIDPGSEVKEYSEHREIPISTPEERFKERHQKERLRTGLEDLGLDEESVEKLTKGKFTADKLKKDVIHK